MLAFVKPARPARVGASSFDRPILPLLAAASLGRPLVPAMQSLMRRHGFDHFMYVYLPDSRPRDARCWCWATHSRAWLDRYDRRAYVDVDPRVVNTFDCATPFVWDSATLRGMSSSLRGFVAFMLSAVNASMISPALAHSLKSLALGMLGFTAASFVLGLV